MSEPEQPQRILVAKEVLVWNPKTREWIKGYIRDRARLPQPTELKWTNTGVNTDVKPDRDVEIDVEEATEISVQADTTVSGNTSTNVDINVYASLDGGKWDSTPYAEMNLGNAEVKTMLVNPGPQKIRLRVDNNVGGTTGYVRVLVKTRE